MKCENVILSMCWNTPMIFITCDGISHCLEPLSRNKVLDKFNEFLYKQEFELVETPRGTRFKIARRKKK
jgi:hypothetical protein